MTPYKVKNQPGTRVTGARSTKATEAPVKPEQRENLTYSTNKPLIECDKNRL